MRNNTTLAWLAICAFLAIVIVSLPKEEKIEQRQTDTIQKESELASKIDLLQCGDSLLVTSEDYKYLLQNDSIQLGSTLFINNVYPRNDYIWRNTKSLYEVRLRNKEIKIKRFCDPEADEMATN